MDQVDAPLQLEPHAMKIKNDCCDIQRWTHSWLGAKQLLLTHRKNVRSLNILFSDSEIQKTVVPGQAYIEVKY